MKDEFYKFPSTPHLALLDDVEVRVDKVMSESERDEFLQHDIVVEEKVDGANLGISFTSSCTLTLQNRGMYLRPPYSGQWKKLNEWLERRLDLFFDSLEDQFVLFGEWCYARHSIGYDRLPDWFLGFDIFDRRRGKFISSPRRDEKFIGLGIFGVPSLKQGRFSLDELIHLLSVSRLGNQPAEGLYLRFDAGDFLRGRAKLVRPMFIQSTAEHWSRKPIKPNRTELEPWA